MESFQLEEYFKAIAHQRRLEIISLCQKAHTVSEISRKLNIPLTRVSEHVTKLFLNNIVMKKKVDQSVYVTSLVEITADGEVKKVRP